MSVCVLMLHLAMQAKRLTGNDTERHDRNRVAQAQHTQGLVLKYTVLIRYKILKQNPQYFLTL